jgi:glycosyltransferase involved in cell wall biosynthesis
MKILYDHQAFTGQRYGGVARYFHDLMESLSTMGVGIELALQFSNNEYLKSSSIRIPKQFRHIFGFMPTSMLVSRTNRLNSIYRIQRGKFDIFHPTFFHSYFLQHIENKPFVLTYHDCIKEKFNLEHIDNASKEQKQELLNRASKIIAVSENTKKDLLTLYEVKADKIAIVHHSTNFIDHKQPAHFHLKTPSNYLLYVGARNDYKNFDGLLKSIKPVLKKHPDIVLLCAGGGNFTEQETVMMKILGIENQVIHQHFYSDNTLFALYQRAIAFVYPSLYEGFGIPILEAFACGCPVVLSDASCFPEVAEDAALYFEATNKDDLSHKLEEVISNNELRISLKNKGLIRQKAFSSDKKAKETFEVYKSVL